jgi:superoxide dismutase
VEGDFGSVAAWKAEFTAMAKAQAGGSGWTTLVWSERLGRLINQWAGRPICAKTHGKKREHGQHSWHLGAKSPNTFRKCHELAFYGVQSLRPIPRPAQICF